MRLYKFIETYLEVNMLITRCLFGVIAVTNSSGIARYLDQEQL